MRKQIFMNRFTSTVSKHEVIKMRNEESLTDRDLLICEFLLNNKFATLAQINQILKVNGFTEMHPTRAFKLSQYRIINRFVLSENEENANLNDDSSLIYCLDLGGKYLLSHYSSTDTTEWTTSENMMSSEKIDNVLMINDIYIKLLSTVKDRLTYFTIMQERRLNKKSTIIDFEFGLKTGDSVKYYIGNFFREDDMPINFQKKAERIEGLLNTEGWKKYYYNSESSPACFFIGETDAFSLQMAKQINSCYAFNGKDRYSSFERLIENNLYDKEAFLKFENEINQDSFKFAKIANFAPEE